jgi:acetyl-CoA C-acetyltransferase
MTVNRVSGSGAQAIVSAAQDILSGQGSVMLAGGMENMDRAPYLMSQGRWGYRMGHAQMYDSMLLDGLHDAFSQKHSGWHTEDLIAQHRVDRETQDRWALRSQQRFVAARDAGRFDAEIIAVDVPARKGTERFDRDEAPHPDTTLEGLARLKPAFRDGGTITAGNAPGLNSGAAAMVVAERAAAEACGLAPMARLAGFAVTAVEPGMFGIAPVSAVKLAVQRAGWRLDDVDRFEINEAYAAIAIIVARELGLDEARVNVEGGAVAHGHPIGATGAILATRLMHAMRREGLRRGVVTLCIGGGQGIALALEAL